jgi:hypothetical protein
MERSLLFSPRSRSLSTPLCSLSALCLCSAAVFTIVHRQAAVSKHRLAHLRSLPTRCRQQDAARPSRGALEPLHPPRCTTMWAASSSCSQVKVPPPRLLPECREAHRTINHRPRPPGRAVPDVSCWPISAAVMSPHPVSFHPSYWPNQFPVVSSCTSCLGHDFIGRILEGLYKHPFF